MACCHTLTRRQTHPILELVLPGLAGHWHDGSFTGEDGRADGVDGRQAQES